MHSYDKKNKTGNTDASVNNDARGGINLPDNRAQTIVLKAQSEKLLQKKEESEGMEMKISEKHKERKKDLLTKIREYYGYPEDHMPDKKEIQVYKEAHGLKD